MGFNPGKHTIKRFALKLKGRHSLAIRSCFLVREELLL